MHILLEHFNKDVPPDNLIDYRTCTLTLEMVIEGRARLYELTQANCKGGVLIVNIESERSLLWNICDRYRQFTDELYKTTIAGFECHVSNDLPRFTEDSRWNYMLSDDHIVGILTYEPAKLL